MRASRLTMRVWRRASLSMSLLLLLCVNAYAGPAVEVEAGRISYEQDGNVVAAEGGVTAGWNDNTLSAESVRIEQDSNRLVARGGIVFDTPSLVLRASSCDLKLDDETGELSDVSVELKNRILSFGGKTVQKHLGRRYSLEEGYYTTCKTEPGRPPEWELSGRKVSVEIDGTGRVRDGAFRVRGVPILYVPYAVFPASQQRQSGLLFPRVGLSSDRGLIYAQPLYWAIDKHQDLTTTFELETAKRMGVDLAYRYRRAPTTFGELSLSYFNEAIRGGFDPQFEVSSPDAQRKIDEFDDKNRGIVSLRHRHKLFAETDVYIDALLTTDDFLLREVNSIDTGYFRSALRRTLRYTDSRLGLLTHQGPVSYGMRLSFYQDLEIGRADRLTLQRPSEAWLSADGSRFGIGYAVDGTLTTFARREGVDGQRFDVSTTLERSLSHRGPLHASAWLKGRFTGYRIVDPHFRDRDGVLLKELDEFAARALGEGGVDARMAFLRDFQVSRGRLMRAFERVAGRFGADDIEPAAVDDETLTIRHILEPFTAFRYTSSSGQDDLPLYDDTDRVEGRSTATYGLATRLLLEGGDEGAGEELARLLLSQTYNVDERVLDDHFSDIDIALSVRPTRRVSFSGLTSYNIDATEVRGAVGWFSFDQFSLPYVKSSGSSMDFVYRFVRQEDLSTIGDDDLETAEARGLFALTDRLSIGLNGRFDFPSSSFVESGGGFRVQSACKCWSIDLGVTNRKNPDETQFRLSVTLAGLGEVGSSALDYQTPGLAGFKRDPAGSSRYGW